MSNSENLVPFPVSLNRAIAQLETHDARLRQNPNVIGVPSIAAAEMESGRVFKVLRIRIREGVTEEDVLRIVHGIQMPVELLIGEDSSNPY